jgi:hypothetical protein
VEGVINMFKKIVILILMAAIAIPFISTSTLAASLPTYDAIGINGWNVDSNLNGLFAVEKNQKWGFADINGKLVIPCQFSKVKSIIDGYAAVCLNNKWGVIDSKGKFIILPQLNIISRLSIYHDYFSIDTGSKLILFDKTGKEFDPKALYPECDNYQILSYDYIAVEKEGRWGIIDRTGKELISPQYPSSIDGWNDYNPPKLINSKGIFAFIQNVKKDENSPDDIRGGIVDKNGDILLPFDYQITGDPMQHSSWFDVYFSEGVAPVQSVSTGKTSYIDENGKIVFSLNVSEVDYNEVPMMAKNFNFSEGLCPFSSNEKWGFIDKTGKTVVASTYDEVYNYKNGYAVVGKNFIYGVIDKTGKVILPINYDMLTNIGSGMFVVSKNDKYGVISSSGKTIVSTIYDEAPVYNANYGVFIVKKAEKYGFVNRSNKIVIPIKYQQVSPFKNHVAKVKLGSLNGYINFSGKEIIPIKYNVLGDVAYNSRIYASDKNGRYIFDLNGKVVFKAKSSVSVY